MKISVIGAGNVGIATAADLSINGHDVTLIKSSLIKSDAFDLLLRNKNRVYLKDQNTYTEAIISDVTTDLSKVAESDVIFVSIQSNYHKDLYSSLSPYLRKEQVLLCVCSYMSSFYLYNLMGNTMSDRFPMVAETTGPHIEGRVELNDKKGEVVFRVGCRLSNIPLSVFDKRTERKCMEVLGQLNDGFNACYSIVESALLNPNLVLHTVGSIMSIPRIEYSKGDFCMYREAYARGNDATLSIMLSLDKEKQNVLQAFGGRPIDIFNAGGFLGDPLESFFSYSGSNDRAISPTSVRSRYITEDVPQGLVLLESMADMAGVSVPITKSLINIAEAALKADFRQNGRSVIGLGAMDYLSNILYRND